MNGERLPLGGLGVLVTRPMGQADALAEQLRAKGATVLHAPAIRITDPPSYAPLDDALRNRAAYNWVVWTSANGVERTFRRLETLGLDSDAFPLCRIAVIGGATAHALTAYGRAPDLVPPEAVAESLLAVLLAAGVGSGVRVLLPQPLISRDVLASGLRAAGATVTVVPAYQTERDAGAAADLRRWMAEGKIDIALVTSPSTVHGLLALLDGDAGALRPLPLACIGPVTAAAVRALGIEPALIATDHTNDGLVAALIDYRTGVPA